MKKNNTIFVITVFLFTIILASACGLRDQLSGLRSEKSIIETHQADRQLTIPVTSGCSKSTGKFEFHEIETEIMTHPLSFRVYLPVCYPLEDYQYPVLYFLHGQSFNDDQWDRLEADETLDMLIQEEEVPPYIIVMPKESNYLNSHYDSKYGDAIATELVEWIDENYNTCTERDCRAIGGISRGAAWSMRIGFIYWDVFGSIGAHSYPPFRGDFNEVPFWLKEMTPDEYPRIWIDIGVLDVDLDAANTFELRLTSYRVPHEWHIYSGTHNEDYWATNVEDYLLWYGKGWKDIALQD